MKELAGEAEAPCGALAAALDEARVAHTAAAAAGEKEARGSSEDDTGRTSDSVRRTAAERMVCAHVLLAWLLRLACERVQSWLARDRATVCSLCLRADVDEGRGTGTAGHSSAGQLLLSKYILEKVLDPPSERALVAGLTQLVE